MTLYSGQDCLESFDLLPLELVSWVVEGLPCYSVLGERLKMERYRGRVTFSCYGKPAKDRLELARYIHIHRFKRDELRAFLEKKHPEMLEYLASKYPQQDPAATTPPTTTTEPGHDQQMEDQEPTNAASYVVWRRKQVRNIHSGQLMLEVQDRWGRPPEKTMDRAEIAALVKGEDPPTESDTDRRRSLENAFKYATGAFKKMPTK